MGIVRVHRAVRVRKDPDAAAAAAVALTAGATGTFGVRARRRDKRFPMRSTELAAYIGTRIQQAHGLKVNLSHPDTGSSSRSTPRRCSSSPAACPARAACRSG